MLPNNSPILIIKGSFLNHLSVCDRVHKGGIDFRVTGSYLQLKRRTVEGISYKHYSPSEALFFTSTVAD